MAGIGFLIWTVVNMDDRIGVNAGVGAAGGHGPVRYSVEEYHPGHSILFRFSGPRGFNGTHRFEVENRHEHTILRHVIEMRATGPALLSWPLLFRPLHDACIEDCFDRATVSLGCSLPHPARYSTYVRILRAVKRMKSKPSQL